MIDDDLTFRAAATAPAAASAAAPASASAPGAEPAAPAPLILVLPGGGYEHHADHEGVPVADWLSGIGVNALVVRYPVHPQLYPAGLTRVQDVLMAVRSGTLDLGSGVDRTRIGVLGFSAGGHVAALMATGVASAPVPAEGRPDLSILAYPVISMTHEPHTGSLQNLLGDNDSLDARRALSAENLVTADTPPTFLWHTADDAAVPVSHSLIYAAALAAHNVPFDLHVFERGDHGRGLATGLGPLERWTSLCEAWLTGHHWLG